MIRLWDPPFWPRTPVLQAGVPHDDDNDTCMTP